MTALFSYFSPKLVARSGPAGCGVYAASPVAAGELLCLWGGRVVTADQLAQMPFGTRREVVQVDEELFLVSMSADEPADCFNHSCAPNAGLRGQVALEALYDIPAGAEVTFDYAMADGSPYDEFECGCGAPACRGRVSGSDWQRRELWVRYRGHFSPYLQRRIDRLQAGAEG